MTVLALEAQSLSVGLKITGADVIGNMEPDHLALAWAWRPAEGWVLWKAELWGARLKQDGKPGKNRMSVRLIIPRLRAEEWLPFAPEWAKHAAQQHAPRTTP